MPLETYKCAIDVAGKDKMNPNGAIIPPIHAIFLIPNRDMSIPVKRPVENDEDLDYCLFSFTIIPMKFVIASLAWQKFKPRIAYSFKIRPSLSLSA